MRKNICLILLIMLMLISVPRVYAKTDAKTLRELKTALANEKKKKQEQENKKKYTKQEINSAQNNIYSSQKAIEEGQNKIEQSKKDIEKLNNEISSTQDNIKNLMNSYELLEGDNAYLDYVFKATSYADLVYRYSLISQIVEYNNSQVNDWEAKVEENKTLQKNLKEEEEKLNKNITSLENQIDKLDNQLDEIIEEAMDIQEEITGLEELVKYYEGMGCKLDQDLDECVNILGDTGFRKPLTKGTITSYFGYRVHPIYKTTKFHTGTDIGGNPEGTNVYSTANGTVGMIVNNTSKKICGGKQVYIYHTINGKKYTSGYMHLLSINVKVGDKVNSNTIIGTVGGGKKTQSWESCSTGAHLHFMIATGWYGSTYTSYSTFTSNLKNAKEILNLPNKYTYWYTR